MMTRSLVPRSLIPWSLSFGLLVAAPARAQIPAPKPAPAPAPALDTRPATTTVMGDTGLWYVPTADILPARKWSASAYRVNFNDNQGFTDVSNWPVTFGYGIRDRAELFGSFVVVNRIDRDVQPLFLGSASGAEAQAANKRVGGFVPPNPLARAGWSGNNVGDLWIGAKINVASQRQQKPAAFAIRGMVKLPAGDKNSGPSTGKEEFLGDVFVIGDGNNLDFFSGFVGHIVPRPTRHLSCN